MSRSARARILVLAVLTAICIASFYVLSPSTLEGPILKRQSNDPAACRKTFREDFSRLINDYRRCLIKELYAKSDIFGHLHQMVDHCMGEILWRTLDTKFIRNEGETKVAILPSLSDAKTPCVEVTLGVGADILAEQKLRGMLPHCEFFGADPILESGKVFEDMGKYFEFAVGGGPTGKQRASVLEKGWYQSKDVMTVNFTEFLKKYVKVDKIDFLWIDNEGGEYEIFRRHLIDVKRTICQVNVEMHGPLSAYEMDTKSVDELIRLIVNDSPFLPMWSQQHVRVHITSFYINVEDEYCLAKFFYRKACI